MKITVFDKEQSGNIKSFFGLEKVDAETIDRFMKSDSHIIGTDCGGDIIGLACFMRNELHPFTLVELIFVAEKRRREGLGTILHKELSLHFPPKEDDFSIDLGCYQNEEAKMHFIESLKPNFKVVGNIVLSCPHEFEPIESREKIISLREYYQNGGNRLDVKRFHCEIYDRDHEQVWPLTKKPEVRADYYLEGDLDFGFVLLNESKKLCGVTLCFKEFSSRLNLENEVSCIHGYAIGQTPHEEFQRIASLYSQQIKEISKTGDKVYVEYDSFERTHNLFKEWAPSPWKRIYRYQLKLK